MVPEPAHGASVLLAFRAENVRSFENGFELSLIATTLAEDRVVRPIALQESKHPVGVLPVAGLFGANASGKSNVLKAMEDMRTLVLQSFRLGAPTGGIPRRPFLLDPSARERPSHFEIDLVLDGVRHEYGFVLDDERVIEEWAFHYPRGRAALLFRRDGDKLEIGSTERSRTRAVVDILRRNALFLSTAASANHPTLLPLYEWFSRNLMLAEINSRPARQALTTNLLDDPEAKARVLELLRAADLGVTGAKLFELEPEVQERIQRGLRIILGQEEGEPEGAIELPPIEQFGVQLMHSGAAEDVALATVDESMGTLVWFGLVGPVIAALTVGSVLLADELDASLHPALVQQLVGVFQEPATNPNRAQLIFNSHDSSLLEDAGGEPLLGRDQVWFTEKLADGATRLYPLSDLDPRKHEAIRKRYLEGRYGGVPILSSRQFEDVAELIVSGD